MSQGGRIFLGISMTLIGIGFFIYIPFAINIGANPTQLILVFGSIGLFCTLVAVACFSDVSHPLTLRIIGLVVFLVCISFIANEYRDYYFSALKAAPGEKKVEPNHWSALGFLSLIGVPSLYAAILGRVPGHGLAGMVFGAQKDRR